MWLKAVFCVVLCSFLCSANKKWDNERSCAKFRNFTRTTPMAQQAARAASLSRLHYHHQMHHIRYDCCGRVISPTLRPAPENTQHSPGTDIGSERPQTHVLHFEATGIDKFRNIQNGTLWLDIGMRGEVSCGSLMTYNSYLTWNSTGTVFEQGSRCTYNVTSRPIRVKTVAVEKQ